MITEILQSHIATTQAFWHAVAAIGSVATICATITLLIILNWAKNAISKEANLQTRRWRYRKFRLPTQNTQIDYPSEENPDKKPRTGPSKDESAEDYMNRT